MGMEGIKLETPLPSISPYAPAVPRDSRQNGLFRINRPYINVIRVTTCWPLPTANDAGDFLMNLTDPQKYLILLKILKLKFTNIPPGGRKVPPVQSLSPLPLVDTPAMMLMHSMLDENNCKYISATVLRYRMLAVFYLFIYLNSIGLTFVSALRAPCQMS